MHIISPDQFTPEMSQEIFERADYMRETEAEQNGRAHLAGRHVGKRMCNLFYEPSTRTRLSFGYAAGALGLHVEGSENASQFSSTVKGETLEDTIRVLNAWDVDIIVLRHTETGAAEIAADVCTHSSLINGGDGTGEHPTQSLLDIYTIQQEKDRLDGLRVTIGGDLKHGRTARSLAKMLSNYPGNHIDFVSTPELGIGEDIKARLDNSGTTFTETTDMMGSISQADVVYWTRLQKERLSKQMPASAEADQGNSYVIDQAALKVMSVNATILHPLPIGNSEISPEVHDDPRAKYFDQAGNGLYVRMALIDLILTEKL